MKMISRLAFVVVATFVAGTALAQGKCKVQTLLIGNATANDTQAAGNDKLAELLTKYSNGCFKASARHGSALGGNREMIAQLQAGSIHGMQLPAGFISGVVPEISMFDMPFLLPGKPALITAFAAQSKAAAEMKKLAEKKGIHVLSFHGIGPQSFLTKFPVSKLSDMILAKSPVAVAMGKETFYRQIEMGMEAAYQLAAETMSCNMMAEDAREGIDAFIAKQPMPDWKGR